MRTITLACSVVVLAASSVSAATPWVPVVVEHSNVQATVETIRAVATALRTEHRIELLDPATAARRFEQVHSFQAVELTPAEVRALADKVYEGTREASLNGWHDADLLIRVFEEAPQAAQDFVTWKNEKVRERRFTYCVMSAANKLAEQSMPAAESIMRRCVLMAPKLKPRGHQISPDVLSLHQRMLEDLRGMCDAQLEGNVEAPASSDSAEEPGCVVVINGQARSAPPVRVVGLFPIATRVQYNCERPGRVHVVKLAPGANSLVIDARWERVVQTRDFIGLRYASIAEERTSQVRDAVRVGAPLSDAPGEVLLVRKPPDGTPTFARIEPRLQKVVAQVELVASPTDEEIVEAAAALATGRSGTISLVPTERLGSADHSPRWQSSRVVGGSVVALLSAGSLATAWLQYDNRQERLLRFDTTQDIADFARYEDLGALALTTGVTGSIAGVGAVVLLSPEAEGVPWWSWGVGALGLGAGTAGVLVWNSGEACAAWGCSTSKTDPVLGQLILLHGAPLVAVPLTYILRDTFDSPTIGASARIGSSSGLIAVEGSF